MSQGLLLSDVVSNLLGALVAECSHVASLLRVANASEEVCNLVGVHARRGYLDRASPIEVIVSKSKGKLLYLKLSEVGRLLDRYEEVCWPHAALGTSDWDKEEVILTARAIDSRTFD